MIDQSKDISTLGRDLRANSEFRGFLGGILAFFLNPGFMLVVIYRMTHDLHRYGRLGKVLSRLVWRLGVFATGCYIHPNAKIGAGLSLPHPTGIVIGANSAIGFDVTIYQNVTIGSNNLNSFEYPSVGDGSVVYAGAVLIGGVTIGPKAIIGANAVVNKDIPGGTAAAGVPARVLVKY